MKNTKLTSVKILENLYERFKLNTVNTKMTLQKLTNRSVDRFLQDEKFREEIETYDNLVVSGSNFKIGEIGYVEEKDSTLVRRLENALWDSNTIKRVCNGNNKTF